MAGQLVATGAHQILYTNYSSHDLAAAVFYIKPRGVVNFLL
jgi:hypothetical protein